MEAQCAGLRGPGQGLSPGYAPALMPIPAPGAFSPSHLLGDPLLLPQGLGSGKKAVCSRTFSDPAQASVHSGLHPAAMGWEAKFWKGCPGPPEQLLPYTVGKQVSSCPWEGDRCV